MLDVPVHKTGTAFAKPIDTIVGEAVSAWEQVRPVQPLALDIKTGEQVDVLFSYRARVIPHHYLNQHLIALLCRKAGIASADAREARSAATGHGRLSRSNSSMPVRRLRFFWTQIWGKTCVPNWSG
jgi:hypothetical protein